MEQGVDAIVTTAYLIWLSITGEINFRRDPLTLVVKRRNWPMAETVWIFTFTIQQIKGQLSATKFNIEATKRLHPTTQRL
ncbi:Uncharacterised protein [Vibrio cholerae]|nr:Uncharacterised protein [Vibrio cholerae]CSB56313.1 Uncharacterised protein [Vibrio cholerae]